MHAEATPGTQIHGEWNHAKNVSGCTGVMRKSTNGKLPRRQYEVARRAWNQKWALIPFL